MVLGRLWISCDIVGCCVWFELVGDCELGVIDWLCGGVVFVIDFGCFVVY